MSSELFHEIWVLVRGGGEVVSASIKRLNWAGFPTAVLELEKPLVVRRLVSFAQAVFTEECDVEGVSGKLVQNLKEAREYIKRSGGVPVLVDPEGNTLSKLNPTIVIDGRMAKKPLDTRIDQAPIVIALGPGFKAGLHCDAVIETMGGSQVGRVFYEGEAFPNTGIPCPSSGYSVKRVLRAPKSGTFNAEKQIGDQVKKGGIIGWINHEPVKAKISGMLRGVLYSGLEVDKGTKVGDIDHRGTSSDCCRTSEKADSIACGVLEALFTLGIEKGIF